MSAKGIYRDGFFKVSRRITGSSLWCEPGDVFKVFLLLLAESQDPGGPRDGTVLIARRLLAAKCLMTEENLDTCLSILSCPDPQSRTPVADGRRIEILPNGFRVLNYGLYHDKAKDRLLSDARSRAGRNGGIASGQARKNQEVAPKQNRSKRESKRSYVDGERDGYRDVDVLLEPVSTEQQQLEAPSALAIVKPKISISELNARFTGCFNAVFDRRCSVQPALEALLRKRCRPEDHKAWQIIASPILAAARQREVKSPGILLRDGKHPRTNGSGVTSGATDWLLWLYSEVDQVVLDPRLASIAAAYDVLEKLKMMNVGVKQESGL